MKKDLLGLKDISAKEIENILETAGTMKLILGQPNKKDSSSSRQNCCKSVL